MQTLINVNTNPPGPAPDYLDFIAAKVKLDTRMGFEVPEAEIFSTLPAHMLRPHQRDIVRWALGAGRWPPRHFCRLWPGQKLYAA